MSVSGNAVRPIRERQASQESSGELKFYQEAITFETAARLELQNITGRINEIVKKSGIRRGFVNLSSLHTTVCVFVNEWQDALLSDMRRALEEWVNPSRYYQHNDPQLSDCARQNAVSHLRALLLGHTLSLQVHKAAVVLGRWQSIILAELDGPQERGMSVQVIGIA